MWRSRPCIRQGVGGALILNGRTTGAQAAWHLSLGTCPSNIPRTSPGGRCRTGGPSTAEGRTFSDECLCSTKERRAYGHVETLAVPARIEGTASSRQARREDQPGGRGHCSPAIPQRENTFVLTPEAGSSHAASRRGPLGRGLSEMINILNPGQLVLRLPRALAAPPPQSSGAEYLAAVEREVDRAYSTGARDARGEHLRLKILPYENHEQMAREVAVAAATTAFNAFLEYTRGFDKRLSARAA